MQNDITGGAPTCRAKKKCSYGAFIIAVQQIVEDLRFRMWKKQNLTFFACRTVPVSLCRDYAVLMRSIPTTRAFNMM